MRRFSKRNSLVTLNEITITPLLDLAFVLLIIFILVSGSVKVEQGIEMNLPQGGKARTERDPKNVRTVSVTRLGGYFLAKQQISLVNLERELVAIHRANPNLVVEIQLDAQGINEHTIALIDVLVRDGIQNIGWATQPRKK